MKHAGLCSFAALAALLLLFFCAHALADESQDRYTILKDYIRTNNIVLRESGEAASSGAVHSKEDFLKHDSAVQFVDLPDGGFLAVYGDVHILDDEPEGHTITAHPDGGFVIDGAGLISLASAEDFAGGKTLIINRTPSGELSDLTAGLAGGFDPETRRVTLAAGEETPHILNYIAGFQAGTEASAGAVNALLGSGGDRYPFDLKDIPISGDITVDMQGYFIVDGSVPSADFWPWEFDLRVKCEVTMHVDSFVLHFSSPSVNKTFDIIPIKIPIVPELLSIDCSPKFFISGMLEGKLDFGYEFSLGGELHIDSSYSVSFDTLADSDSWLNSADVRAEIYAGLDFGASLDVLGVCSLGLHYKLGLVTEAKLFTNTQEQDRWHACRDFECLQGNIHPRKGPLSIDVDVLDGLLTKTLWSIVDPTDGDPLVNFHDSFTYGGGLRLTKCPHYAYRLDVHVTDRQGNPIEGALVSFAECPERYASAGNNIRTGSDGVAVLYIPDRDPEQAEMISDPGYAVTLTAVCGSGEEERSAQLSFTERGLGSDGKLLDPSVTLTLDVPSYTVSWYIDRCDGNGYGSDPWKRSVRAGAPGTEAAVTEADRTMITDENGTRYLLDELEARNVLSGTVAHDGSLELKLYFQRCGVITFDAAGGNGEMDPIYCLFGRFVPLPICQFTYPQEGMAFEGWDAFQTITGPGTQVALTLGELETLEVKAVWVTKEFGTPDMVLPAGLKEIGQEAFRGIPPCRVSVPEGCECIRANAFADIWQTLYIRIPASCIVEEDAFSGCRDVLIFAPPGSSAEAYCRSHGNCSYVYWTQGW